MIGVYILLTSVGTKYIGSTTNLARRLNEHNKGSVYSTKSKRPLKLFAFRKCSYIKEAALWERKYKRSHGQLERDLKKGIVAQFPEVL